MEVDGGVGKRGDLGGIGRDGGRVEGRQRSARGGDGLAGKTTFATGRERDVRDVRISAVRPRSYGYRRCVRFRPLAGAC